MLRTPAPLIGALGVSADLSVDCYSETEEAQMMFTLECEVEDDGRWLAEVPELPGVLAYGSSRNEALANAEILALRVIAEQLENSETAPYEIQISIPA